MRLAEDEITITLPPRVFMLRASLRAAFRLYKRHGNYSTLSHAIASGSFSAHCDVIKEACADRKALSMFYATADKVGLRNAILGSRDQLLEFVLILAGGNRSGDQLPETGEPITFDEYHTKLFQIATGWLGWSPTDAWDATPAEIINAHQGRRDMLAALFVSKRDEAETIDPKSVDARAQLNALGDLGVTSMSEVR